MAVARKLDKPKAEVAPAPPLKARPVETGPSVEEVLAAAAPGRGGILRRRPLAALALAALLLALGYWTYTQLRPASQRAYLTEAVSIGDLTVIVTATGSIQPTNQVDISSEQSGVVRKVLVDTNDRVTKGQLLAELDKDRLEAQVARSRATLAAAEARLREVKATAEQTGRERTRVKTLEKRGYSPDKDMEAAIASHERALAQVESAKADIAVAEADLRVNETNLAKASITSPIGGVVLSRSVEPGQTVAASLQAPILFTLAEDLKQMELKVDVDEADIGRVKPGQVATFGVDAYPDKRFPATIEDVYFASEVVQGVVTYKAILAVDNSELLLRPGMTATADITVEQVAQALLLPNAALRFTPPSDTGQQGDTRSFLQRIIGGMPRFRPPSVPEERGPKRTIYVLKDGAPSPVAVSVGSSDGKHTVLTDAPLQAGEVVIVDTDAKAK